MPDKMFNPANAPFVTNAPIVPTNTAMSAPVTVPIAPASTSASDDNYDDMATTVEVGDRISEYPIDKFRAVKGKVSRIAILSRKWKAVKSHFEKGVGNFYCFDGVCCQGEKGRAKRKYLVPVQVYETDIKGQVITKAVNIQYLVLSGRDYEPLSLIDSGQPLNTGDLNVLCEDEQYQTKNFILIPGKALWLQDEEMKTAVVAEYKRLEPFILKAFARKLGSSPEESQAMFLKLKNASSGFSGAVDAAQGQAIAHPAIDPTPTDFNIDELL
jgi:hypothetical protein